MAIGVPRNGSNRRNAADPAELSGIDPQAQLSLAYAGKASEPTILAQPPVRTVPVWSKDASAGDPDRLYYGDNLPILAALMQDERVRGRVKLIYIDPPFATNSVFQSRCQTDAYDDLLAGAPYIEFLRHRLVLLRELLAENGSIYVHLDQKMAFHAKVIMDETFGARNFRSWITRKKCNPKNYTRKVYGNTADYILFYSKSDDYEWNRPYEKWTAERAAKEYPYTEESTGRRYKKVPVHAPGVRRGKTGQPWRGRNPPPGKHWQYLPEKLDELDARGEIYWSPNGNPRRKVYLDESQGVSIQDIWLEFRDAHNQMIEITGYPTEKNPDLLARIIRASSNAGDLILDCFAGSGTTLAVAAELRRRWIGIDNSPQAIRHMLRRFAVGRERMGDFVNRDAKARKNGPRAKPLALFPMDDDESGTETKPTTASANRPAMPAFSLYAEESKVQELQPLMDEWMRESPGDHA